MRCAGVERGMTGGGREGGREGRKEKGSAFLMTTKPLDGGRKRGKKELDSRREKRIQGLVSHPGKESDPVVTPRPGFLPARDQGVRNAPGLGGREGAVEGKKLSPHHSEVLPGPSWSTQLHFPPACLPSLPLPPSCLERFVQGLERLGGAVPGVALIDGDVDV